MELELAGGIQQEQGYHARDASCQTSFGVNNSTTLWNCYGHSLQMSTSSLQPTLFPAVVFWNGIPEIVDACYIPLDPVPGSRTDDPVTHIQPRIILESENQCHSLLNGESEAHADVY